MVPDPYKALGLSSHDASPKQIKDAYRKLAMRLHPDRLTRQNASESEMQQATAEFAKVSAAYGLLTDLQRKREYDHIYKFGGYDDIDDDHITNQSIGGNNNGGGGRGTKRQQQQGPYSTSSSSPNASSYSGAGGAGGDPALKKSARGIGYTCTDHFAYILSQGTRSSTSVAGIQIPARLHMSRPPAGAGGFRLSFSSGQWATSPTGTKRYESKTTQFVAGKKFTRVETTVVHPDGRKEIVIEGDDYVERRSTPPTRTIPTQLGSSSQSHQSCHHVSSDGDVPWYMEAWHGIKDKLTACYSPCLPVQVQ